MGVEAAFFSYLVQVSDQWYAAKFPIPVLNPTESDVVVILSDLPVDVANRVYKFLDANYLTPRAQRSNADGRRARALEVVE